MRCNFGAFGDKLVLVCIPVLSPELWCDGDIAFGLLAITLAGMASAAMHDGPKAKDHLFFKQWMHKRGIGMVNCDIRSGLHTGAIEW